MRIIFVRHGHPDYTLDCLTELGHKQAEAVAKRLEGETIHKICASTKGRAMETAAHIAQLKGMEVEYYDFMREIGWGSVDDEPLFEKGHPWFTVFDMVERGQSLLSPNWAQEEPFCRNKVVGYVEAVAENLDKWLEQFGYFREGEYYRVKGGTDETVVMVSHGGSSSAALARLFNLTFPQVLKMINPAFTAITVVNLKGEDGSLAAPRFDLVNDARHIAGITAETVFEQ